MLAGERPALVKGVVNFVGGWHSVSDKYSASDNQLRLNAQTVRLAAAAKKNSVPSLWIYAARDPFYNETTSRELFRAWREAGGKGDYIFVTEHSLAIGHMITSDVALWGHQVDEFLKTIDSVKQ